MQKSDAQPQLSIIVPMLNEEDQLPNLLRHLLYRQRKGCEVLPTGSHDGSAKLAERYR
jgi:glycosyltransferase involved in cell wall biosynthesis